MAGRIIFWLLAVGAIAFALQGGEYSSVDLWRQRQIKQKLAGETDTLATLVDSLRREADKVLHDPATQERIAREQFGMVRGEKEILYRLGTPTDTSSK